MPILFGWAFLLRLEKCDLLCFEQDDLISALGNVAVNFFFASYGVRELALAFIPRGWPRPLLRASGARPGPATPSGTRTSRKPGRNKAAASRHGPNFASAPTLRPPPCAVTHIIRKSSIPSMSRRGAKFYWPSVQFLSERVDWPFELRVKCKN
jgi:hypothetical protein